MCRGFAEKFFFDGADKECKPFTYGGCLGNANNFASQEECLSTCAPPVIDGINLSLLINTSSKLVNIFLFSAKARARARARFGTPEEEEPVITSNKSEIIFIFHWQLYSFFFVDRRHRYIGRVSLQIRQSDFENRRPFDGFRNSL